MASDSNRIVNNSSHSRAIDCNIGYAWLAQIKTAQERDEINGILEQRMTEVRLLHEQIQFENVDLCRRLEEEWLALVTEKDRNFRAQIEEENEEAKRHHIRQLYKVLETLNSFSFTQPGEATLKRNLTKIYYQVDKYCSRNNIRVNQQTRQPSEWPTVGETGPSAIQQVPPLPPPPPPPLPPPPPTPLTHNKALGQQVIDSRVSQKRRHISPVKKYSKTPHATTNDQVLKTIRNGCRKQLRRTPFKRSPGGTPLQQRRPASEDDNVGFITFALKRKFQSIAVQSPNENDSPRSYVSPGDL